MILARGAAAERRRQVQRADRRPDTHGSRGPVSAPPLADVDAHHAPSVPEAFVDVEDILATIRVVAKRRER